MYIQKKRKKEIFYVNQGLRDRREMRVFQYGFVRARSLINDTSYDDLHFLGRFVAVSTNNVVPYQQESIVEYDGEEDRHNHRNRHSNCHVTYKI